MPEALTFAPCPFVKFHLHDDNGNPATGWRLYAFVSGTDDPATLYKDAGGSASYGAYLTLNSRGEPDGDGVFLDTAIAYKLVLTRPDGSTAWSQPYVKVSVASSSMPSVVLPGRSLFGNTSLSTADALAVSIDSGIDGGANSVPSSLAVSEALAALSESVVHNAGAQSIIGSLTVSGDVNAGSLTIAGENTDDRYLRVAGHTGKCVIGRAVDGVGAVNDIPVTDVIAVETTDSEIPSVRAVRDFVGGVEGGLVKIDAGDVAGYLGGKIVGDDVSIDVAKVNGSLRVSVASDVLANAGKTKTTEGDSLGYLTDKLTAGDGISVGIDESGKVRIGNTAADSMTVKAHAASTIPGFLSSIVQAGTGLNVSLSADMEKLVITATGSAVGGFYWKGTWDAEGTYNVNNAVWYFDHTGDLPISRLYIATAQNQGINPYNDAGIGTGTCWSCMMAVDYMGDQFVMLDATDTRSGFLADKIKAGNYITLTKTESVNGSFWTVDTVAPYQIKLGEVIKSYNELGGIIEIEAVGGSASWNGSKILLTTLTIGESSSTAYRGDRGKTAYDHSQTTGNPHNTAPSDISGLSTYVDGRITAVAEPKYTNYTRSVTTNEWWQGIGFRVPKTIQYADAGGLIEISCSSGVNPALTYSAIVHVMARNQNNSYSSVVQEIAGGSLARGNIRYWVEDTGSSYTVWIIPYLPAYAVCNIKVMRSFNSLGETLSTQTSTTNYTGVLPVAGEQFVTQNSGIFGNGVLVGAKGGYAGLTAAGQKRIVFMSDASATACGLYNETDSKWLVLFDGQSGLVTDYTPSVNSDSGEIPTTAWVKDVAPQVSTGFSSNTKMIYCAASERGTDVNTLYFCY